MNRFTAVCSVWPWATGISRRDAPKDSDIATLRTLRGEFEIKNLCVLCASAVNPRFFPFSLQRTRSLW
jgi:hypothetical protein